MIYFLYHNIKLHKMIEMHLKYDNMHTNKIFNAFNCINNHVNSCINCMLSVPMPALWEFSILFSFSCVKSIEKEIQVSTDCVDNARG